MPPHLDAIYLDHRRLLLGLALRILRDPQAAEDVIQESYLRTKSAAERGPIDNVLGFLHRTVHNLALDHVRRRRTQDRFEVAGADGPVALTVPSDDPSAEEHLLQRERLELFRAALAGLPERARRVWILNRVEGWSYARIAGHLGVSPGTVFNDMKLAMGHVVDAMARSERQ